MKKILALAMLMTLGLMLTGCGGDSKPADTTPPASTNAPAAPK